MTSLRIGPDAVNGALGGFCGCGEVTLSRLRTLEDEGEGALAVLGFGVALEMGRPAGVFCMNLFGCKNITLSQCTSETKYL